MPQSLSTQPEPQVVPAARSARSPARVLVPVLVGAVPWSWFVLRDRLGAFGDLVSLGLPLLAVPCVGLLAVGAFWVRWRVVIAWMVSWSLVFAVGVFGPRLPSRMGAPLDPITVVSANVRYDNPTPLGAAEDLLAEDADVVVVPEATRQLVRAIAPSYPHHLDTQGSSNYGIAVFSRFPLRNQQLLSIGNGGLRVEVDAPTPFVLYATHLSRPVLSPTNPAHVTHAENYRQVVALDERAARETLPVVLAGDFNLSDRVRGYRLLTDHLTDVTRDGWATTTYVGSWYRLFLLRIDHVFASDGWCADEVDDFAVTGSDHRALRLDLGECS